MELLDGKLYRKKYRLDEHVQINTNITNRLDVIWAPGAANIRTGLQNVTPSHQKSPIAPSKPHFPDVYSTFCQEDYIPPEDQAHFGYGDSYSYLLHAHVHAPVIQDDRLVHGLEPVTADI